MSLIKLIDLPSLGDQRGGLVAIESNQSIPFEIKRLYYIFNTTHQSRGFHAHIDLKQIAVLEILDVNVQLQLGIIYKKDFQLSNISSEFIDMISTHPFFPQQ